MQASLRINLPASCLLTSTICSFSARQLTSLCWLDPTVLFRGALAATQQIAVTIWEVPEATGTAARRFVPTHRAHPPGTNRYVRVDPRSLCPGGAKSLCPRRPGRVPTVWCLHRTPRPQFWWWKRYRVPQIGRVKRSPILIWSASRLRVAAKSELSSHRDPLQKDAALVYSGTHVPWAYLIIIIS